MMSVSAKKPEKRRGSLRTENEEGRVIGWRLEAGGPPPPSG
jgi:hypothetical protein